MIASGLCQTFNALAQETWAHMHFGFRLGYGRPDERAFTDHHLIELMRRHPAQVKSVKIDQNREAETGADFEWFLGEGRNYLRMRVQAKKLDLTSDSYPEITNRIGRGPELQIDRLLASSKADGFLALYCFFNGPPLSGVWPSDRCENPRLETSVRGCTVALANDVQAALGRGRSLAALGPLSRPWQCLTCCPLSRGDNPGRRALDLLGQGIEDADALQEVELGPLLPYAERARTVDVAGDLPPLKEDEPWPGARTVVVMTV
jgi:uncharacterized protein DUF6615